MKTSTKKQTSNTWVKPIAWLIETLIRVVTGVLLCIKVHNFVAYFLAAYLFATASVIIFVHFEKAHHDTTN